MRQEPRQIQKAAPTRAMKSNKRGAFSGLRFGTPFVAGLSVFLAACAIFPPIGQDDGRRLVSMWTTSLYPLDTLAYHPKEEATALYVRDESVASGGRLIVPARDRKVRALDPLTGEELWSIDTGGPNAAKPLSLAPWGYPGEILFASYDGRVYRVRVADGEVVWISKTKGDGAITATPSVNADGTQVYMTSMEDRVSALSLATGERIWAMERPSAQGLSVTGQAGALPWKDRVLTGFSDGRLVAYAQHDGEELWSLDLSAGRTTFVDVDITPQRVRLYDDSEVVVSGSFAGGLVAIDPQEGTIRWHIAADSFVTPVIVDRVVYAVRARGELWAIDAESGQVKWRTTFRTPWAGVPTATRKYILVPIGEALSLVERGSGREVFRWDDGRGVKATPEIAYGWAFILANSGRAYGVEIY